MVGYSDGVDLGLLERDFRVVIVKVVPDDAGRRRHASCIRVNAGTDHGPGHMGGVIAQTNLLLVGHPPGQLLMGGTNFAAIPHAQDLARAVERQPQRTAGPHLVGRYGIRRGEIFIDVVEWTIADKPPQGDPSAVAQNPPQGKAAQKGLDLDVQPVSLTRGIQPLVQAVHFDPLEPVEASYLSKCRIVYGSINGAQNSNKTP